MAITSQVSVLFT